MTAFCPACCQETHTDTLLACTDYNRARIPARIFCAACGHWLGWAEAEPEPVVIAAPVAPPATNLADGLGAALWRHVGRLAGGVW